MQPNSVAIIGGGLSGLAAGIHLARDGFQVTLFEANDAVGGCCSTTTIDGYTFNDGALYVALPQLLDHAFARLGLDRPSLLPLRRIGKPQASFLPDGTAVVFDDRGGVRIDGRDGALRTARLQAEIERCIARWGPLLRIFSDDLLTQPFSMPRVLSKAWRHLYKLHGTLADELRRLFSDPDARAALAAVTLYTGLPPERTPIFQIVGIVSLLQDGLHLPEGGMGAIGDALLKTFREVGGSVRIRMPVARIRIAAGCVRSLVLANGEEFATDAVVSTVGAMTTFRDLMEPSDVPSAMLQRVQDAQLSHRALCVQLGLANMVQVPAHAVNHVPLMEDQQRMLSPQPATSDWVTNTVPTSTMPELAANGGSIIELFAAVDPQMPLDAWDVHAKEAAADTAIAILSKYQPLDIAVRRMISPKDYADRMHLFGGALYGLSPAATPAQQFPHATTVHGLYLAGQTTYPGFGVAPAMFSGIFAAEALAKSGANR